MQGDSFPFYVTWKGVLDKFVVIYSSGIELTAVNNVGVDAIHLDEGRFEVTSFEVEGYVSGLFDGIFDKERNSTIEAIEFELYSGKRVERVQKSITLFRSDIEVLESPELITLDIKTNQRTKEETIFPSDFVSLRNNGQGTSVIIVNIESDRVKVALPSDYEASEHQLREDLELEVLKVIVKYPQHKSVLTNYLTILKDPFSDELTQELKKDIYQNVSDIIDDNEVLREDLFSGILSAITRNISFTNMLRNFLAYLNSIKPSKVILLNPYMELEVPAGTSEIKMNFSITDFSWNEYDKLTTKSLKVTSPKATRFNIVELLNFEGSEIQ